MHSSTRAVQSFLLLVFLTPVLSLADGDSLFSIHDNAVIRGDVTEAFLTSHFVKKFTIITIDTNRLREEIRSASQLPNTRDGRPLRFDLFEDLSLILTPTLVQNMSGGVTTGMAFWGGKLESVTDFFASVGLHINQNDEVKGNFRTSLGRIRVEPTEELPYHIVWLQDFDAEQEGQENGG